MPVQLDDQTRLTAYRKELSAPFRAMEPYLHGPIGQQFNREVEADLIAEHLNQSVLGSRWASGFLESSLNDPARGVGTAGGSLSEFYGLGGEVSPRGLLSGGIGATLQSLWTRSESLEQITFSLPFTETPEVDRLIELGRQADEFLENQYSKMGTWLGGNAQSLNAKSGGLIFWRSLGALGAFWIVDRLKRETDSEMLSLGALTLGSIGSEAIPAITRGIEQDRSSRTTDRLLALLSAIDLFDDELPDELEKPLREALERLREHSDADIREATLELFEA